MSLSLFDGALDQGPDPMSDVAIDMLVRNRIQAHIPQRPIDTVGDILPGINQRPIQIPNQQIHIRHVRKQSHPPPERNPLTHSPSSPLDILHTPCYPIAL